MNILTWNCSMAFRKKYKNVITKRLDLAVIQECENPAKLKTALKNIKHNQIIWHGNNPNKGIAVISFGNLNIELNKSFNPEFEFILPIKLTNGKRVVNLFALWAMPHPTSYSKSYVGQIWQAIHYYKKLLKEESILIGDFNSNSIWDHKRKEGNHSHVVELLEHLQIESLYHQIRNHQHGKESQPTFYLLKNRKKPYHLDYCFVTKSMINRHTKLQIGSYKKWIGLSDHMPIWIDNI